MMLKGLGSRKKQFTDLLPLGEFANSGRQRVLTEVSYPVLGFGILPRFAEGHEEGERFPDLTARGNPEAVSTGVGEHDFLKWENDSRLRGRLIGTPGFDFGLSLDRENHLVFLIDEIRAEGLATLFTRRPFDDEHDGHLILRGREPWRTELIEDSRNVQLSVRS